MTFDFYESIRVRVKSNKQLKLLLFEVNKKLLMICGIGRGGITATVNYRFRR